MASGLFSFCLLISQTRKVGRTSIVLSNISLWVCSAKDVALTCNWANLMTCGHWKVALFFMGMFSVPFFCIDAATHWTCLSTGLLSSFGSWRCPTECQNQHRLVRSAQLGAEFREMGVVTTSAAMNCEVNLVCLLELNHWGKLSSSSRNRIVKFLSTQAMKDLAINEEICWWWWLLIQLILMGSIWQLTPLRAVFSDSLQNLQTLADPCSELPLIHLLAWDVVSLRSASMVS